MKKKLETTTTIAMVLTAAVTLLSVVVFVAAVIALLTGKGISGPELLVPVLIVSGLAGATGVTMFRAWTM